MENARQRDEENHYWKLIYKITLYKCATEEIKLLLRWLLNISAAVDVSLPTLFSYSSDLPVPDPDSAVYKYQQGSVSETVFMLPTIRNPAMLLWPTTYTHVKTAHYWHRV